MLTFNNKKWIFLLLIDNLMMVPLSLNHITNIDTSNIELNTPLHVEVFHENVT